MEKLVKLTQCGGEPVLINPALVCSVVLATSDSTQYGLIRMADANTWKVDKASHDILLKAFDVGEK